MIPFRARDIVLLGLSTPFLPKPGRIANASEVMDGERLIRHGRRVVFATANLDVGAVAPDLDVGKISVNPQTGAGDDPREARHVDAVIGIEVYEAHRHDGFVRRLEKRAQARELPV